MVRFTLLAAGLALLALSFCAPAIKTSPARYSLENEKLFLYPVVNNSAMAGQANWPSDSGERTVLAGYFPQLEKKILTELRRCEKYGRYSVTDDSAAAGVRCAVTLQPAIKRADTLWINAVLQVMPRTGKIKALDTLIACGVYKPNSAAEKPLYYWGYILADYVRSFPCERLAQAFYARRLP
jgi:hypothetical protein